MQRIGASRAAAGRPAAEAGRAWTLSLVADWPAPKGTDVRLRLPVLSSVLCPRSLRLDHGAALGLTFQENGALRCRRGCQGE